MKAIGLNSDEFVRYQQVGAELKQLDRNVVFCTSGDILLPREVKAGRNYRCFVTGAKIAKRQPCIVIRDAGQHRLAVLCGRTELQLLLQAGTIVGFPIRKSKAEPKAKPVLPHMNVCFCVQCGKRVIRPEEMPFVEFAVLRRCGDCKVAGKSMLLGVKRFCRTCGVPFIPEGKSGHSESTCPEHGRHVQQE